MKYCLKHTLNTKYKTKKKWHPTITRHFLAPLSACPQGAAELLCRWSLSGAALTPPSSTHSAAGDQPPQHRSLHSLSSSSSSRNGLCLLFHPAKHHPTKSVFWGRFFCCCCCFFNTLCSLRSKCPLTLQVSAKGVLFQKCSLCSPDQVRLN